MDGLNSHTYINMINKVVMGTCSLWTGGWSCICVWLRDAVLCVTLFLLGFGCVEQFYSISFLDDGVDIMSVVVLFVIY